MFAFLSDFLQKKAIDCFAPIALSDCNVTRPYLLDRAGISDGTVIILAVPYYTVACESPDRNLSAYAVSRDYHGFFASLFDELILLLKKNFPEHRFAGFADHSPIEETVAAARAGLGVIGKNHLLITKKYSSYVFLGELVTDAILPTKLSPIDFCEACGACMRACPADDCGGCLSALTQKKGELTEEETAAILRYGSAWGCDRCQEVCPHTMRAIADRSILSPIPYFSEQTLPHLTSNILDAMSEEEFSRRAYAWRGRDTIRRNLILMEDHRTKKETPEC